MSELTPENVETPQCFCADIGESCDICLPENVESSGCIWCKGRPLPDHDCKNFEQFTGNVETFNE